jgi:hypothetical protein
MTWFDDLYKRFNIKKKLKRKKNNKKIDRNQQNRIEKYSRDLSDGQVTESYNNRNQQNRIEKYSRDLSQSGGQVTESCNRNALNSVRSDSGWLNITQSCKNGWY